MKIIIHWILVEQYRSVSRIFKPHATITEKTDGFYIEDRSQKCGVRINNNNNGFIGESKLKNKDKIKCSTGKYSAELVFIRN